MQGKVPLEIIPSRSGLSARCLSKRQVAALYPADPASRYEGPMLTWALVFYGLYALLIAGAISPAVYVPLAVLSLLRYFNRAHEQLHADPRGATPWHLSRLVLIVMGPVYLGYRELREMHFTHHRLDGDTRDPDRKIMRGSLLRAALRCLCDPELSVYYYISHHGLRPRLAAGLLGRASAWSLLMGLGGWEGLLYYNLAARLGNGLAWFVFSRVAHSTWLYGQVSPPAIPRAFAAAWTLLICRENLHGVRFHFLHHLFPTVPDRYLPRLSQQLLALEQQSLQR